MNANKCSEKSLCLQHHYIQIVEEVDKVQTQSTQNAPHTTGSFASMHVASATFSSFRCLHDFRNCMSYCKDCKGEDACNPQFVMGFSKEFSIHFCNSFNMYVLVCH
uniref:Uncharacterized protein n=1 Tax=Physcomitrium patens TaxID=3218 RepID=A0A2K1JHT2_PHYPA|nr:hypothetical protein PHYPA_018520 [Physcomitrium patens]